MKIELRKLKREFYDKLMSNLSKNKNLYLLGSEITLEINNNIYNMYDMSEPIINSKKIEVDIDEINFNPNMKKYRENFLIGKMLHTKFSRIENIPLNILYEKEFWAYISHTPIFQKYIKERYLDDDTENARLINKIKRYYFCDGQRSRTGLMFLWSLTEMTYSTDKLYELSEISFSFIDSVRAIYERNFSKNRSIIKAFVEGIKRNNKTNVFKHKDYRSYIPTHISNLAAINLLDAYSYEDLINVITREQELIINQFKSNRK